MDFFTRSDVMPMGVSMVYDSRDVPTGEAYVEFTNVDDLQRGMNLHKETMGHRYIEVFRSTRQEAMSVRDLLLSLCVYICMPLCLFLCVNLCKAGKLCEKVCEAEKLCEKVCEAGKLCEKVCEAEKLCEKVYVYSYTHAHACMHSYCFMKQTTSVYVESVRLCVFCVCTYLTLRKETMGADSGSESHFLCS
jgi:hypothetical protein